MNQKYSPSASTMTKTAIIYFRKMSRKKCGEQDSNTAQDGSMRDNQTKTSSLCCTMQATDSNLCEQQGQCKVRDALHIHSSALSLLSIITECTDAT